MRAYIVRRVLQMIPVLVLASIAIWAVIYTVPGSPAIAIAGENATPQQIAAISRRLGLDQPVIVQYWLWLTHALTGDLGVSAISQQPVTMLLLQRIPATLQLAAFSVSLGVAFAVPLALALALRRSTWIGRLVGVYQAVALAVPTFWTGILLILAFSVQLKVLPGLASFVPVWEDPLGAIRQLLLPSVTLGIYISGIVARFLASSLADAMAQPYVVTARSKGVSERTVVMSHALRNALLPAVTIIGMQFGLFLGGAVVTETVFNYPGLGRLIYSAVNARDYPVLQGALLFVVVVFLVINLLVDVIYAYLDPRIKLG
jgi:peptide/nickel transport system permease protein